MLIAYHNTYFVIFDIFYSICISCVQSTNIQNQLFRVLQTYGWKLFRLERWWIIKVLHLKPTINHRYKKWYWEQTISILMMRWSIFFLMIFMFIFNDIINFFSNSRWYNIVDSTSFRCTKCGQSQVGQTKKENRLIK